MKKRRLFVLVVALTAAACSPVVDAPSDPIHREPAPSLGGEYRRAFEGVVALHEETLERNPNDARAHAGVAEAFATLWCFGYYSREGALPRARDAANRATELGSDVAAAHVALGIVRLCDWDWDGARLSLEHAIRLDPTDARARHWYALYLAAMGDHPRAIAESTRATELAPDELGFKIGKAAVLYFAREFATMRDHLRDVIAIDPASPWAHDWLGMAYVELNAFDEAIPTYETAARLSDKTAEVYAGLGHAYAEAGRETEARAVLEELERAAERWHVPPVQRAYICVGLREKQRAYELLEEAYRERAWELVFVREEPWFDELRDDTRFRDLVERMALPAKPPR